MNVISESGEGKGGLGRVNPGPHHPGTGVLLRQFPYILACQSSGLCVEGRKNIRDLEQVVRKAFVWGTSKVGPEQDRRKWGTIALRGGGAE